MSHTRRRGGPFGFTCRVSTRRHVAKWKERRSRNRAPILRIPPKLVKPLYPLSTYKTDPQPRPILFFSVVVAASHAAFFQALPLSFSPSVVGPTSNAALPLRLLPPLSSSTLVIEDPGFFACVPAPSHGAFFFLSSLYCVVVARHQMAPPQGACGRGCAPVPNSIWGRGLSERSEFRSPNLSGPGQRPPKGHARAPMVLGPFAETKGPRRAGPKPRNSPLGVRGRNPANIPTLRLSASP